MSELMIANIFLIIMSMFAIFLAVCVLIQRRSANNLIKIINREMSLRANLLFSLRESRATQPRFLNFPIKGKYSLRAKDEV